MLVKQICPAIGWTALYKDQDENGEKVITSLPLACWALVISDFNNVEVTGLITENGHLISATKKENFNGYDYDTEGSLVDFALMNNDSE
ncbi:MAG: hypothetical protein ACXABY_23340 [Candidatus Thorarchaeota archaeon]